MPMSLSKEIGGFFEFESFGADFMPEGGIYLNSARNALRYVIKAYGIKKMYVPAYTCPTVWHAIKAENCEMCLYEIDAHFRPIQEFEKDAFILYNNYFGVCGQNVQEMIQKYSNIIIDNAQSLYSPVLGLASFYSPRKFFGLPDGGILYCNKKIHERFEQDTSFERCTHLLKRVDLGAQEAYADFRKNDDALDNQPIRLMSKLTRKMMGNFNPEKAKEQRLKNFSLLHSVLKEKNKLNFEISSTDVPMAYPFLTEQKGLREKLIENRIFIARYWGGLEEEAQSFDYSLYLADNLLPLPLDQRYDETDMQRILEVLDV